MDKPMKRRNKQKELINIYLVTPSKIVTWGKFTDGLRSWWQVVSYYQAVLP